MSKKKEEQLAQAQKTAEAARQAAAPQSGYSTADLNSRSGVPALPERDGRGQ